MQVVQKPNPRCPPLVVSWLDQGWVAEIIVYCAIGKDMVFYNDGAPKFVLINNQKITESRLRAHSHLATCLYHLISSVANMHSFNPALPSYNHHHSAILVA